MASVLALAARYVDAPDPVARASNRLVMILLANQPTYPLLVGWATGSWTESLALLMVSTPFFCAVPWVTRRAPGMGVLAFPAIGALNTAFCTMVLGRASGVEVFLVPCVVIAVLVRPPTGSKRATGAMIAFLYATFAVGRLLPLVPVVTLGPEQLEALVSLNAWSAASFTAMAAWTLLRAKSPVVVQYGVRRSLPGYSIAPTEALR